MNEPIKQQAGLHSIFSKIDAEEQAEAQDFRPPSARAAAYTSDVHVTAAPQRQEDEYDRIGALMTVLSRTVYGSMARRTSRHSTSMRALSSMCPGLLSEG